MKKINWFKLLLYGSLLFLAYSLYKANYLVIPTIYSYSKLGLSIFFLLFGMTIMTINWKDVLKKSYDLSISFNDSIIANGLSIFTKYIPGKVLVIMGRALYISNKYDFDIKKSSFASLQTQIITLWVGFFFGLSLFFIISFERIYWVSASLFMLAFSLFLFSQAFKAFVTKITEKFFKKSFDYPVVSFFEFLQLLPSFVINWLAWIIAYFLFAQALSPDSVSILVGLCFPLAATFAIIALISPGGIGIREGILVFAMLGLGMDKQSAITISTASRLWFLIGEIFIFVLALILNRKSSTLVK